MKNIKKYLIISASRAPATQSMPCKELLYTYIYTRHIYTCHVQTTEQ